MQCFGAPGELALAVVYVLVLVFVVIWETGAVYRVSYKKGINKKLLFGAAQGLNLQFLDSVYL